MKKIFGVALAAVFLAAGMGWAQDGADSTAAQQAAQAAAAKVMAVSDDAAAADALAAAIQEMMQDAQKVADGVPELTLAVLVKSDPVRAAAILPLFFAKASEFAPLALFQRMAAASFSSGGSE